LNQADARIDAPVAPYRIRRQDYRMRDLHPIDRARGNAEMPIRLQHWRNTARKYQRPIVSGIALVIVALCMISLAEMLWTTTPIVFGRGGNSLGTSTTTGNTTTFYGPGGNVTGKTVGPVGNGPFGNGPRR
jgi:hypothetical protein